jgi:undecaprenyl-diphosphatase
MSRSMVTIVGGYLAGLNPARAAEFSFLVGLPTLAGAALLKGWQSGPAMIEVFGWNHVLLGIVVAAVSAAVAVKFLVHFLTRHGLALFAYYRLVMAVVLLVFTLSRH